MTNLAVKLDFCVRNNLNVLLTGNHGVGKTTLVKDAFERSGLKWLYFSAATMDPWVDFIGVPKEKAEGDQLYLELVRPKVFAEDQVEALFFDELNRAPKKVRNAVMELIQFRSINGKKFNNLRMIWAAINPEDENETYDVERLDPAQQDRFEVHLTIPDTPYRPYFVETYGAKGATACEWWSNIPTELRKEVSPRRLEYALKVFNMGGDLRDVLPHKTNIKQLTIELSSGSIRTQIEEIFSTKDENLAKKFVANDTNFQIGLDIMKENENVLEFFLPHVDEERLTSLLCNDSFILDHVLYASRILQYHNVIKEVVHNNGAPKKVITTIKTAINKNQHILENSDFIKLALSYHTPPKSPLLDYDTYISRLSEFIQKAANENNNAPDRLEIYGVLTDSYPVEFKAATHATLTLMAEFFIIQNSQPSTIKTNYPALIALINTTVKDMEKFNVNVNSPEIRKLFDPNVSGKVKFRDPIKIQKFLDFHDKHLYVNPKII